MEATWFPGGTINRIDNDGHYNRLNCEWTTHEGPQQNTQRLRTTNTSGFRGVSFDRARGKFVASITCNGHVKSLGRFASIEEAAAAYEQAEISKRLGRQSERWFAPEIRKHEKLLAERTSELQQLAHTVEQRLINLAAKSSTKLHQRNK
jgi:hypothetical protein